MKPFTITILLFAFTLPCQAVQKCTDSNGRVTYADFCSASEPAKVESLYIPDTYDAEADRQAQINTLEMEQRTRQGAYERQQRNAGNRQINTAPSMYTPSPSVSKTPRTSHRGQWQDKKHCAYSCSKDPNCNVAVTCYGGSKRATATGVENKNGVFFPETGKFMPKTGNTYFDPETGKHYPKSGKGFFDPETGEYHPTH